MRSVRHGVIGFLLAIAALIAVRSASAQLAAPEIRQDEAKLPTGVPLTGQPAEAKAKTILGLRNRLSRTSNNSRANFAETRTAVESARTGRRSGGSEASEPTTNAPAFGSPRRWPPAHETRSTDAGNGKAGVILFDDDPKPAADNGKAGTIVFDNDPTPPAQPMLAKTATSPPPVPTDLQRQVQSACGRQAQAVLVETQRDGTVMVKVKVPSLSVQDQLTRKIFAIPGMTSPKVRLVMDVGP